MAFLQRVIIHYISGGQLHIDLNIIIAAAFRCLILFLALIGLFYVAYYRSISLLQKKQIAQSKALADEAQLLMLRYQINPHFLFNSLNAIQAMIEKDKVRAKDMIADLSDFFRYTLSKNNNTLVPLKEEIEAIKKYLAIQKERFADRLEINYELDEPSMKIMLPFFIIHPLVENAIKYGFTAGTETL
jgi:LytS/YehU family sensor histidine kinase